MLQEENSGVNNDVGSGGTFDLAVKCSKVYHTSTKIGCVVIDKTGGIFYDACDTKSCNICALLSKKTDRGNLCANTRLYGAYQAERFGGKYIYACHLGLMHWTAPLVIRGALQGAIVGGPAHVGEFDEFYVEELVRNNSIHKDMKAEALVLLRELPVLTSEEIDNLSELLFIIGAHVSDIPATDYYEDRKYLEHQSDISEFMNHLKALGADEKTITCYPLEKEKELMALISIGDKVGAKKVLNEIFSHILLMTNGSFEVIKAWVLDLTVLLSRAAIEGGADIEQIFGLTYKYASEIDGFHSVEELITWLSKIMVRFTDCVFNLTDVKHIDIIFRAIDYIKKNYMKKITLEEVSSHVYLSPSYFSKIFKREMKLNFNAYLNNVRIEMSKKHLLDDAIVLADVPNLVGYEDQSYFSKVFKKIVGISPGKYRETRAQFRAMQ